MREGVTLFGITDVPRWIPHASKIWAGVALCFWAMANYIHTSCMRKGSHVILLGLHTSLGSSMIGDDVLPNGE